MSLTKKPKGSSEAMKNKILSHKVRTLGRNARPGAPQTSLLPMTKGVFDKYADHKRLKLENARLKRKLRLDDDSESDRESDRDETAVVPDAQPLPPLPPAPTTPEHLSFTTTSGSSSSSSSSGSSSEDSSASESESTADESEEDYVPAAHRCPFIVGEAKETTSVPVAECVSSSESEDSEHGQTPGPPLPRSQTPELFNPNEELSEALTADIQPINVGAIG